MSRVDTETRVEILNAAWALIEREGAAAVRLADVAKQAGVSRQAVYLKFGSRVGLFVALVAYIDEVGRTGEQAARWRSAETGEAKLEAFLEWWNGYVPQIRPVANALLAERARDAAAGAAWQSRMEALHRATHYVVAALAKEGTLAPGWRVPEAADWLWGLVSIQLRETMAERGWSRRRYADRLRRVVRAALLR